VISVAQRETLAKWKAALRSGEYEQTRGALVTEKRGGTPVYCCLGVLCKIMGRPEDVRNAKFQFEEWRQDSGWLLGTPDYTWFESVTGLSAINPNAYAGHKGTALDRLVYANDASMLSFVEIADLIDTLEKEETSHVKS
jgi:hypothetical protein